MIRRHAASGVEDTIIVVAYHNGGRIMHSHAAAAESSHLRSDARVKVCLRWLRECKTRRREQSNHMESEFCSLRRGGGRRAGGGGGGGGGGRRGGGRAD